MRAHWIGAALLAAFALLAPQARAHHDGEEHVAKVKAAVSREQAIERARTEGLARLRETKLRDGVWKVEGWTRDGRPIEVKIDAANGAVREVSRR